MMNGLLLACIGLAMMIISTIYFIIINYYLEKTVAKLKSIESEKTIIPKVDYSEWYKVKTIFPDNIGILEDWQPCDFFRINIVNSRSRCVGWRGGDGKRKKYMIPTNKDIEFRLGIMGDDMHPKIKVLNVIDYGETATIEGVKLVNFMKDW